jgi:hypothetical protein
MFVARWQFTSRSGKLEETLSILRNWERHVGERVGWKSGSVRVLTGYLGSNDSAIEFEAHIDNLADLEAAWGDADRNPHHAEYLKQLAAVTVDGTSHWTILREITLIPQGD